MKFDPFNSRLSRDIRNNLSRELMSALKSQDIRPVVILAEQYLEQDNESYQREYIEKRIACYERVLKRVKGYAFGDVNHLTIHLWDEELFYEVHEYLEYHWKRAEGAEKLFLQAMIRAAGTYVHLEQGNVKGAEKMAAKAVGALEASGKSLPGYFNLGLLLSKLSDLDPVPPKLTRRF